MALELCPENNGPLKSSPLFQRICKIAYLMIHNIRQSRVWPSGKWR